MNRIGGILLAALGALFLVWGFNSAHPPGSEISEIFAQTPSDRSLWLIIGGVGALVAGMSLTSRKAGRHHT